jgi:hypothetical protein
MPHIYLSGKHGKGHHTLVDEDIYKQYGHLKWHLSSTGYAVRRSNNKTVRLHRLVVNAPVEKIVDHINHDPLDNRRANLRICTQSENMRNKTDQGKGYWYQKQNRNWVVEICTKHVGCFDTEEQAIKIAEFVRNGGSYVKPLAPKTECKYGHDLSNAYVYGKNVFCKVCTSNRCRKYYQRKKGGLVYPRQ